MKKTIFEGCATAICTPFYKEEKEDKVNSSGINYEELEKFIEFQIENKIDAIVVCGTTGEASTLTTKEKKEIIKFTVEKVKNRIPVIAGTGGNNTKTVIELTKYAEKTGADGVLIVTPYYNKTTQEGLIEHYKIIAQNTKIPIILYNVPSRTGVNIEPQTCLELSKIENIVGIKEASGNISQVAKIAALCGKNLDIYSGNDDQIIPILSLGGKGVISVLSNIKPEFTHNIVKKYQQGRTKEALKMQLESIELIQALFSKVNPIPVKEALNIIGFNFGNVRMPLYKMDEKSIENLKKILF